MRSIYLVIGILSVQSLFGQIPASLVQSRSIVVMDLPLTREGEFLTRGDWTDQAKFIQKNLGYMGVDAISYVHGGDWNASQEIFREHFIKRKVNYIITLTKEEKLFRLNIQDFDKNISVWKSDGGSLSQLMFRLGKDIKSSGHVIENFLAVDDPEIVSDVPFTKYSASQKFPDQIMRLSIGVARFENEKDNQKLEQILSNYPFKYELIDYTTDEDAFRKGYQYVLLHMSTAGSSIKNFLNYRTDKNETDYMSTVKGDSTNTELKAIPVDAFVHKFYFRRTVNHEVQVGNLWDADTTWEQALDNFILNLRIAFRKI